MILTGRVAIAVTNGERQEFGPGAVLLIEDTTGVPGQNGRHHE
jgi:hypothetical protein